MANDLKELRNMSFFMFTMLNAIFIIIMFLLQLNKDKIHLQWPLGVKTNITFIEGTDKVSIEKTYLQLEPIGLLFVFFFALIIVIQFVAMLFHRFGTISHILASTDLCCCNKKSEELSEQAFVEKKAVDIVKEMQRLGDPKDFEDNDIGRRRTIHEIEKGRNRPPVIGTLDVAFRKRFLSMAAEKADGSVDGTPVLGDKRNSKRRETFNILAEKSRNMQQEQKKKSKIVTLGRQGPRVRNSIASDADNERIFSPSGGHVNEAYDAASDIYGDIALKVNGRHSRASEDNVLYKP